MRVCSGDRCLQVGQSDCVVCHSPEAGVILGSVQGMRLTLVLYLFNHPIMYVRIHRFSPVVEYDGVTSAKYAQHNTDIKQLPVGRGGHQGAIILYEDSICLLCTRTFMCFTNMLSSMYNSSDDLWELGG